MGGRSARKGGRETDLRDGTDEDSETAADHEFCKTQKGGAVDVNEKVDDALHGSEGETGGVEGGLERIELRGCEIEAGPEFVCGGQDT